MVPSFFCISKVFVWKCVWPLSISLSLSLSLPPSFSLWFHNTCHLMLFTQYSLLDQFYFCTSCLSIVHFKFTNKMHQLFTDYLLRLPYSELLETHLFRSRANRRLVLFAFYINDIFSPSGWEKRGVTGVCCPSISQNNIHQSWECDDAGCSGVLWEYLVPTIFHCTDLFVVCSKKKEFEDRWGHNLFEPTPDPFVSPRRRRALEMLWCASGWLQALLQHLQSKPGCCVVSSLWTNSVFCKLTQQIHSKPRSWFVFSLPNSFCMFWMSGFFGCCRRLQALLQHLQSQQHIQSQPKALFCFEVI